MSIGLLILHFQFPGCSTLKDKRSRIKPILARLHREFNVSTAEVDRQDAWHEAVIACVTVSNDGLFNQKMLQKVVVFVEDNWPDCPLLEQHIETIS
jgi:uncharacterized protein